MVRITLRRRSGMLHGFVRSSLLKTYAIRLLCEVDRQNITCNVAGEGEGRTPKHEFLYTAESQRNLPPLNVDSVFAGAVIEKWT